MFFSILVIWGGRSLQLSALSFELLGCSPLGFLLIWSGSPGALSTSPLADLWLKPAQG